MILILRTAANRVATGLCNLKDSMRSYPCLIAALILLFPEASCAQVKTATSKERQQTERAIAEMVATEDLLRLVAQETKLLKYYASPPPMDQPVEFVVAHAVYSPDSELFQLQLKVAKIAIDTTVRLSNGPEYVDAVLANAARALVAASDDQKSEDVFENLEVTRNERLTGAVAAAILKSSAILEGARSARDRLSDRLVEAIKRHPEQLSALAARKPISNRLRESRAGVQKLLQAARAGQ